MTQNFYIALITHIVIYEIPVRSPSSPHYNQL